MGILKSIKEGVSYQKMTKESLQEAVNHVFRNSPKPQGRQIKFMTGEMGMWTFQFLIAYGDTLKGKFVIHKFKKDLGYRYFSLFKKHGVYKLRIKGGTFEFLKGTEVFHRIEGVINTWYANSGTLSDVQKNKQKMKEVNDFIEQLKKDIKNV